MTYLPAQQRLNGFRDELVEWGLEPLDVAHGDFHMQSGSMAMANLIHRAPDIDGLFSGSDLMAAGALRVLNASGRSVPEDVAVVGFDDTVVAATSAPPLTSINQPLRELGARAAELALTALADGTAEPRQLVLPTTVTWRESV
jgi:DNA-binding LacI/PurR family transcriptional regulator